jgi:YXWGXW repeat-containing protein
VRPLYLLRGLVVALALSAVPAPSVAQIYLNVGAPPLLPQYTMPLAQAPNSIWQPGYWAWGRNGYYWVPGTWVPAPQPNVYWTPGYWGASPSGLGFGWNQGYWAPQVGYYGGINYGGGYYGNGYTGGNWSNGTFMYNTAVSPVNTTVIRNVYVNRTVIVTRATRISFNGPGGILVRPTPAQLAVLRLQRLPLTPWQREHILEAARDRNLLARVNGGKPRVVVVARPLSATNRSPDFKPVTSADRIAAHPMHPTDASHPGAPVHLEAAHPVARVHPAPHVVPKAHPVAKPAHAAKPPAKPAQNKKPDEKPKPPSGRTR